MPPAGPSQQVRSWGRSQLLPPPPGSLSGSALPQPAGRPPPAEGRRPRSSAGSTTRPTSATRRQRHPDQPVGLTARHGRSDRLRVPGASGGPLPNRRPARRERRTRAGEQQAHRQLADSRLREETPVLAPARREGHPAGPDRCRATLRRLPSPSLPSVASLVRPGQRDGDESAAGPCRMRLPIRPPLAAAPSNWAHPAAPHRHPLELGRFTDPGGR